MINTLQSLISFIEDKGRHQENKSEEIITEEEYVQMEKNFIRFLDASFKKVSFSWNIKKIYLNMEWQARKNMLKMLDIKFLKLSDDEIMTVVLNALETQLEINRYCDKLLGKK